VLRSLRRLLPRMHLAGFSSTVLQPLMKVGYSGGGGGGMGAGGFGGGMGGAGVADGTGECELGERRPLRGQWIKRGNQKGVCCAA
jgi:hypothetical protein